MPWVIIMAQVELNFERGSKKHEHNYALYFVKIIIINYNVT